MAFHPSPNAITGGYLGIRGKRAYTGQTLQGGEKAKDGKKKNREGGEEAGVVAGEEDKV